MNSKKNFRRIEVLVSSQTLYHLYEFAVMSGYGKNIGKVIDKIVREKMIQLSGGSDIPRRGGKKL